MSTSTVQHKPCLKHAVDTGHCDTAIKPLYGKQEGALIGYSPKKPARPSHALHTYFGELKNQWGWGKFTTQDMARNRHQS